MFVCCRSWWPLYRYVLARLILCISHLLSVPPAEFLYEIARVDARSGPAVGEQGPDEPADGAQGPPTAAIAAASGLCSTVATAAGSQTDSESCHIALKAAFEMLNLLALREDVEDCDGSKREQMHRFVAMLLPRLKRFEKPCGQGGWLFHVNLHAVVVWAVFSSEIHREHMISGSGLAAKLSSPGSHGGPHLLNASHAASQEGLLIGRLCFQHRLGFDLPVLSCAELVTSSGSKAVCYLEVFNGNKHGPDTGKGEADTFAEPTSVTLIHGALCSFDVYLERQAAREISGSKLRCLHLSWALCPSICFQLATLCSSERGLCRLPKATAAPSDLSNSQAVPSGYWPPPLRRAILVHRLCIPPPALCDIACPGLAEPHLPSLCLSKVRCLRKSSSMLLNYP